jgi:hypothetical protein
LISSLPVVVRTAAAAAAADAYVDDCTNQPSQPENKRTTHSINRLLSLSLSLSPNNCSSSSYSQFNGKIVSNRTNVAFVVVFCNDGEEGEWAMEGQMLQR